MHSGTCERRRYPEAKPRSSRTGGHSSFARRDFKEFIRISGMTLCTQHLRFIPNRNGKNRALAQIFKK